MSSQIVQALCFLGNSAVASLGLEDQTLKVHSIVSGSLLLSSSTPHNQNELITATVLIRETVVL